MPLWRYGNTLLVFRQQRNGKIRRVWNNRPVPRRNPIEPCDLEIAGRFKHARVELHAARSHVALMIGLDSQTIVRIEVGRVPLKYKIAREFCRTFKISPVWLATGHGPRAFAFVLPEAAVLGVAENSRFSEVFKSKLAGVLKLRSEDELWECVTSDFSPGSPGMRLDCIGEMTLRLKKWFLEVPDAHCSDFNQWLILQAKERLARYPKDAWDVQERRRVDMEQLDQISEEDRRPALDASRSRALLEILGRGFQFSSKARVGVGRDLKRVMAGSLWQELLWRLDVALHRRDFSEGLEKLFGVTREMILSWKMTKTRPDAETALRLLAWIAVQGITDTSQERRSQIIPPPPESSENPLTSVTPSGKSAAVTGELDSLIDRAKRACEPRGSGHRKRLAKFLGVPMPRISEWLSGAKTPAGPTTLRLLEWVTAEEAKPKQSAAGVSPQAAPKAQKQATHHENKRNRPKSRGAR